MTRLHCLGVLLDHKNSNPCNNIKDKESLALNLVSGLQLPSEEIRGEILFVLYKILILQNMFKYDNGTDAFITCGPKLLRLSLEALMKTESDDVRLNCIALMSVLAQRGFFESACGIDISSGDAYEDDNFMETNQLSDRSMMTRLFAEAIKAPLLSSDNQVQTATLPTRLRNSAILRGHIQEVTLFSFNPVACLCLILRKSYSFPGLKMHALTNIIRTYQETCRLAVLQHWHLRASARCGFVTSSVTEDKSPTMQNKGLENTTVAEVFMTKGEEQVGSWIWCRTDDTVHDAVKQDNITKKLTTGDTASNELGAKHGPNWLKGRCLKSGMSSSNELGAKHM